MGAAKYSPGSVWVLEGGKGLKFHPNGDIEILDLITPVGFLNGSSLYFPQYNTYLYTQPYDTLIRRLLKVDSLGNEIMEVKTWFGINLRDKDNKIILGGDSLFGYHTRTNSTIFLPLSDSLAYFISIGTPYCFFQDTLNIRQEYPFLLENTKKYIKPRLYFSTIKYHNGTLHVIKRQEIVADVDVCNKIAACKHANGKDWWLIAHERNASNGFLRFHVSESGVKQFPTQYIGKIHCPIFYDTTRQYVDRINYGDLGQLCFTKNGDKLASVAVASNAILDTAYDIVDIFDFDRCTGELSNYFDLKKHRYLGDFNMYLSCQFSSNGNNLFLGTPQYMWFPQLLTVMGIRKDIQRSDKDTFFIRNTFPILNNSVYDSTLLFLEVSPNELREIRNGNILLTDAILEPNYHNINKEKLHFNTKKVLDKIPILGILPNTANHLLPAIPYDFSVDRKPLSYRDTLCIYDSTALGGWYPAGKHLHRWYPTSGLSNDTSGLVTFRPPLINKQDTVYTFYLHTEGRPGGCLEGQSRIDTFRVFVWGNGRGGCRTVSRLDAIPPQVFQIYPNPTNGTLYIKSSWEEMKKVLLYNMAGQVVFERQLSSTEATLHIGDLADGTYLCKITTTEGIFTQKVVLAR